MQIFHISLWKEIILKQWCHILSTQHIKDVSNNSNHHHHHHHHVKGVEARLLLATVNPWVPPRASSPPNRIDPISALLHLFEDSHTPHTIHTDKHSINYTQTNTQSHMCIQTHTTHTTHITDTQRHTHSETALFFAKLYKDMDLCCRSYRGSILVHRNTQVQSIGIVLKHICHVYFQYILDAPSLHWAARFKCCFGGSSR